MKYLLAVLLTTLCLSCSFSYQNLKKATVESTGYPPSANVTILRVTHKDNVTSWIAKVNNECFECVLDETGQTKSVKIDCVFVNQY